MFRFAWLLLAAWVVCMLQSGCAASRKSGQEREVMYLEDESIDLNEEYFPRRKMNALEEAQWLRYIGAINRRLDEMEAAGEIDRAAIAGARKELMDDLRSARSVFSDIPKPVEQQIATLVNRMNVMTMKIMRTPERVIREVTAPVQRLPRRYQFIWPLTDYTVSSEFGWRRHPLYHRRQMHDGIDLAAPAGALVRAAAPGKVIFTGYKSRAGNVVILEHPGGWRTYYAHLEEILVVPGMLTPQGSPIGTLGASGIATGAHLHFKVTHGNQLVNPRRVMGTTVDAQADYDD